MAKVERFEDLIAWQKAHLLAKEIYEITRSGQFAKDFGLSNQMQRAGVSAMSNIAEGFERYTRADFQRFLDIARGSCGELRAQLYLARDVGYVSGEKFAQLIALAEETSRVIRGLRDSLDRK